MENGAEEKDRSPGRPASGRILPWAVLLLASLVLLFFLNRGCSPGKPLDAIGDQTEQATPIRLLDLNLPEGSPVSAFLRAVESGEPYPKAGYILDEVRFAKDSVELNTASSAQLAPLALILQEYPSIRIRIEGHTDNSGDVRENLETSRLRALAVRTYLERKGIPAQRMVVVGRGRYKPLVPNVNDANKEKNNRIEIYFEQ